MTSDSWISVGRFLMVTAAMLAIVSAGLLFTAIDNDPVVVLPMSRDDPRTQAVHITGFMVGIMVAVLAGVAFFSGLASFFWSATLRRHELLEEILRKLPD
ncbi:hypothetical protein [Actinomadura oligospora]|uniref:hypothetical protein n=1 Tax=Actinomadura oligospora TaxID=111804 RepID=UPI0004788CE3|nr:hypothetical protein [Actinomadura oligospora]